MASYDILTYLDLRTKRQKYLVVPQRCGSSFAKAIIKNFPASQRSNLQTIKDIPFKAIESLRENDKVGFFDLDQSHLLWPPTVDTKIVYRHPIARYASALPMLLGEQWEHFQEWLPTANLNAGTRDRTIAEGYCEYMDIPYEAVFGPTDSLTEHKPLYDYNLERVMDTVIAAHPFSDTNIWWEPTFGESHLRPVMLQTAVLACLDQHPEFIELENFTEWVGRELLGNFDMSTISKPEMTQQFLNGRGHLPLGSSAVASDPGQYCLNYLVKKCPQAFEPAHNHRETLPLHFEQYMAPDVDTYNFVYKHNGNFINNRELLVDFLVELFTQYPYAITRSTHAIRWFANNLTLQKLPPRLAKAIRENIKSGLQYINDHSYFHLAEYLDDQF